MRFAIRSILNAACVLALVSPALAQQPAAPTSGPTSVPIPNPIPTPAPGGTPVTFGGVPLGAPIMNPTPAVEATTVPTTAPNGRKAYTTDEKRESFVAGDYLITPKVFNDYDEQGFRTGKSSYSIRGNVEFSIGNLPLMIGGDFRSYRAVHEPGYVTVIGHDGQTYVNGFTTTDQDFDGRLGLKILEPRVYLAASYLEKYSDTGFPHVTGEGLGIEKLPDFESPLSVYFSAFYYPNLTGQFTAIGTATSLGLRYSDFRYRAGATLSPQNSPIVIDLGILGDKIGAKLSAPTGEEHFSPYVGIGFYSHK